MSSIIFCPRLIGQDPQKKKVNFLKLVFLAPLIIYQSLIENGETSITRQVLAVEKTWPATAPYTYYNQLKIELQNLVSSKKIYHQISHLNRRVPQPLPSHITLEHHIPCSTNWLIIIQINCPQLRFFDASVVKLLILVKHMSTFQ